MGVETKKMAKSAAITGPSDQSFGSRLKSWPEQTKSFYHDVRTEMKKVSSPSLKEVQATTVVVIITVALFAVYFWAVDNVMARGIDFLFRHFAHR